MTAELSHDAVNELLPWYVNATLSPHERVVVERHLATCDACTRDVHSLSQVSSALGELTPTPSVVSSLARTMAAVDGLERSQGGERGWWLSSWFQAFWNPSIPLARAALATQLAMILILIGLIASARMREQSFTTLSGPGAQSGGARLTVIFEPSISEEALRTALLEIGGHVVSGPSAAGVYIVELPGGADDDSAVEAVITKLRGNRAVIRFVEREP